MSLLQQNDRMFGEDDDIFNQARNSPQGQAVQGQNPVGNALLSLDPQEDATPVTQGSQGTLEPERSPYEDGGMGGYTNPGGLPFVPGSNAPGDPVYIPPAPP